MKRLLPLLLLSGAAATSQAGALKTDVVMDVKQNINLEYEVYAAPQITAGLGVSYHLESSEIGFGLNGYYNFNGTFAQGPQFGGGLSLSLNEGETKLYYYLLAGFQLRVDQFFFVPMIAIGNGDPQFKFNIGIDI